MTSGVYMQQLSVWVGTGIVTAGVSAALLAAAGVATADTGTDSQSEVCPCWGLRLPPRPNRTRPAPKRTRLAPKRRPIPRAPAQRRTRTRTSRIRLPTRKKDDTKKDDTKKDDESTSESTGPDDEATPASSVKPTAEAPKKKSATAEPWTKSPR